LEPVFTHRGISGLAEMDPWSVPGALPPRAGPGIPGFGKTGPFRARALPCSWVGQRGFGGGSSIVLVEGRWEGSIMGGLPSMVCYSLEVGGCQEPDRGRGGRNKVPPPRACLGGATPPLGSEAILDR
jgi:hypothetical protein